MPRPPRLPALFVGHGSPVNALLDNPYTRSLRSLAGVLPRPEAVCVVSAHWLTTGTRVACGPSLRQIHDFYGFPAALYRIRYQPPGHPEKARRALELLGGETEGVACDDAWGHDHAGWTVLMHLYPEADVPTFFVSIDLGAPPARHAELGRRLAPLREEGVLVLGSGNLVHNLALADLGNPDALPDPRGVRFDQAARGALLTGDLDALVDYERHGDAARFSVPTRDHYLPLLWVAALRQPGEPVSFPCELFQNGAVSMRSVRLG
ncbi:MAG: 4,5-DOPA-extradiol-dioxygenase [Deferrisomatales bacterium]